MVVVTAKREQGGPQRELGRLCRKLGGPWRQLRGFQRQLGTFWGAKNETGLRLKCGLRLKWANGKVSEDAGRASEAARGISHPCMSRFFKWEFIVFLSY